MRVKVLTGEQKQAIQDLQSPEEIPLQERRRQYTAIGRVMKSGKDLPEGLIQKWNATGKDSMKKPLGYRVRRLSASIAKVRILEGILDRPHVPDDEGRVLLDRVSASNLTIYYIRIGT